MVSTAMALATLPPLAPPCLLYTSLPLSLPLYRSVFYRLQIIRGRASGSVSSYRSFCSCKSESSARWLLAISHSLSPGEA